MNFSKFLSFKNKNINVTNLIFDLTFLNMYNVINHLESGDLYALTNYKHNLRR